MEPIRGIIVGADFSAPDAVIVHVAVPPTTRIGHLAVAIISADDFDALLDPHEVVRPPATRSLYEELGRPARDIEAWLDGEGPITPPLI